MKAFYFVAVVAAAVASVNARAKAPASHIKTVDFDCSGKPDGNYAHPTNCNGFISCSGGVMYERDCATCNYDPVRCPNERTVYNASVDACLWADETACGSDGGSGEVTEAPIVEPTNRPTTQDAGESGGASSSERSSEEPPTTTEESEGGSTDRPPQEGDSCDPENCVNRGYCQSYLRCDKDTQKLVREDCGEGLVWNPLNENKTEQIHGGNCDIWENLDARVERRYRTDPECLACFWRATGECERDYLYQAPGLRHRNVLTLSCSPGLVFSEEKETCQLCSDVKRSNGTACC